MSVLYNTMFVGVDDDGLVVARYDHKSAEELMEHIPDVVLHKVPGEIGEVGRSIYKYKVVEGGRSFSKMSRVISFNKTNKPTSTPIIRRETNSSQKRIGRRPKTVL